MHTAPRTWSLLLATLWVPALLAAGAAEPRTATRSAAVAFPGGNGDLVFASIAVRNGPFDLYLMRPDGTRKRRITKTRAFERFPTWSRRGKWIAYTSDRSRPGAERAYEIYVMRPNGTGLRRLTRDRWTDDGVTWSPFGTHVVFGSNRPPGGGLWVMNVSGRRLRRVTPNGMTPAWSPDGRTIAFARRLSGSPAYAIWLIGPDGTNERRLTEPPRSGDTDYAQDFMPDWSPDGRQVAFSRRYRGRTDIYVIRADGSGLRRVTHQVGLHDWPAWSPDGGRIAFRTTYGRSQSIDVINADGRHHRRLATGAVAYAYLDWQPLR